MHPGIDGPGNGLISIINFMLHIFGFGINLIGSLAFILNSEIIKFAILYSIFWIIQINWKYQAHCCQTE